MRAYSGLELNHHPFQDFASRKIRSHGYYVSIICTDADVDGMREQTLFNRATGEVLGVRITMDTVVSALSGRMATSVIIRCEQNGG